MYGSVWRGVLEVMADSDASSDLELTVKQIDPRACAFAEGYGDVHTYQQNKILEKALS